MNTNSLILDKPAIAGISPFNTHSESEVSKYLQVTTDQTRCSRCLHDKMLELDEVTDSIDVDFYEESLSGLQGVFDSYQEEIGFIHLNDNYIGEQLAICWEEFKNLNARVLEVVSMLEEEMQFEPE